MSDIRLKVLTLNCWGVPFVCPLRPERFKAIAEELSKGEYDIIMLQEVWSQADYRLLCDKLTNALPHSHYFHSGNIGSGVCLFSKHLIYDTAQYSFTLNGYPHRVFNGDWFCKKSVGLCKILVDGLKVYVYSAHLHAQYADPDHYESHRISQAFEMSEFIRQTGVGAHVLFVGGDFNFTPQQLGYQVISRCANLRDAWLHREDRVGDGYVATSNRSDNSFHNSLDHNPTGHTLDFILYRPNNGYRMDCETCYLTMQSVPDQSYNYSDHEGVAAVFRIKPDLTAESDSLKVSTIAECLTSVLPILDAGLHNVKASRFYYMVRAVLTLTLVLFIVYTAILGVLPRILEFFCEGALLLIAAFYTVMATLWTDRELNGLISVQARTKIALRSLEINRQLYK